MVVVGLESSLSDADDTDALDDEEVENDGKRVGMMSLLFSVIESAREEVTIDDDDDKEEELASFSFSVLDCGRIPVKKLFTPLFSALLVSSSSSSSTSLSAAEMLSSSIDPSSVLL